MNKKIQILMTAGLLGLTASCTDLDVDIDSQYTEYPSSSEAIGASPSCNRRGKAYCYF